MDVDQKTLLRALFKLSVDTNLEFVKEATDKGPLFEFMLMARHDAIDALADLVNVDPVRPDEIRKHQNNVKRFIDTLTFVRTVFNKGDEAAAMLSHDEAEELRDIVAAEGGEVPGEDE
jgi:hypothetical protein